MKTATIITSLLLAASTNMMAQNTTAVTSNKFLDNWYVGVNFGATTAMQDNRSFNLFTPTSGLRLGKQFTTVFGIVADAEMYTNFKPNLVSDTKCFVDAVNVSLLGSCNLSNAIATYLGKPRHVEVSALAGLGWGHPFGVYADYNYLTGKVALDVAYNFGKDREWQVYLEPAVTYALEGYRRAAGTTTTQGYNFSLSPKHGQLCAKVGVNYKFKTSNGHHNFTRVNVVSEADMQQINAEVNKLRAQVTDRDKALTEADEKIAYLEQQLNQYKNVPNASAPVADGTQPIATNIQYVVAFDFNSVTISSTEEPNIINVAAYMINNPKSHIAIYGYTAFDTQPESDNDIKQKRAEVVRDLLVYKYGISADRITATGLAVDQKLLIEPAAPRVVVFTDTTK